MPSAAERARYDPDVPVSVIWDLTAERVIMRSISQPYGLLDDDNSISTHPHAFYNYCLLVFGFSPYMKDNPNDQWFTQFFHRPFCDWLQHHILEWWEWGQQGTHRRKKIMAMMPRFSGKTMICTAASTSWGLLLDPNIIASIGSEIREKAADFLTPIKEVISGGSPYSRWVWLFGNFLDKNRTWEKARIVHAWRTNMAMKEPSVGTFGMDSGITAYHPYFGWIDDPLSESKMRDSGTWLSTVVQAVGQLRPAFRPWSFMGVVLTRKADEDVAGVHLEREGIREWTGHTSDDLKFQKSMRPDGEWSVYFMYARDPDTGQSILPLQTTSELDAYQQTQPAEFAREMMNSPGSGEHMALDVSQIDDMWVSEDELPSGMLYSIHLDTAFKDLVAKGSDDSVIVSAGHDPRGNGRIYYIEGHGSRLWRGDEFTEEFVKLIQRYHALRRRIAIITDEMEGSRDKGEIWKAHLINAMHHVGLALPRFEFLKRGGRKKSYKLMDAANLWAEGRVRLVRGAPNVGNLVHQMLRIGVSAHDDWADAFADAFAPIVYRPMLLRAREPVTNIPVQPGDESLKSASYVERQRKAVAAYDRLANEQKRQARIEDSLWPKW